MSHLNIENFKFCLKFIAESSVKNANILNDQSGKKPTSRRVLLEPICGRAVNFGDVAFEKFHFSCGRFRLSI